MPFRNTHSQPKTVFQTAPEALRVTSSVRPKLGSGHSERILLVDDVADNIQLAGGILRDEGYKVHVARDGKQALELARKIRPDLILLDVVMPEMDGFECCKHLKEGPDTRDIPVIFLTLKKQSEEIVLGFELGAVDYIPKPFNAKEMLTRIHTHLVLRHMRVQIESVTRKVSRYVSPHVFATIASGQKEVVVESSKKPLTIFFSDIVGFTHRTQEMGDQEVCRMLNSYFQTMSEIVQKYGGTLDKFIGDAVMVFFGDPISRGVVEDAVAAVQMALEMSRVLAAEGIPVRFGLNSGISLVGHFGTEQQLNYTILGKAVAIASQMEHHSEAGRILVAEPTHQLVQHCFRSEPNRPIPISGLKEDVMSYWIHG